MRHLSPLCLKLPLMIVLPFTDEMGDAIAPRRLPPRAVNIFF